MFGDFSARLQTLTTSKASTELLAVLFLAIEGDTIGLIVDGSVKRPKD